MKDHEELRSDDREPPARVPESVELIDTRHGAVMPPPAKGVTARVPRRPRRRVALVLFAATCASTFLLGMIPGAGIPLAFLMAGQEPIPELPMLLRNGALYSAAIMAILLFHEMGHYLQTRRYGIPATLPIFIPFPVSPFGTMGAVILQDGTRADRRMLFDIAISGPLAGLLVALPVTCAGVATARIETLPVDGRVTAYGNPLLLEWLVAVLNRPLQPGEDVMLTNNPLLFAGWVGIFITALNLVPIGQLDGGHILYTMIGRRAHAVAWLLMAAAVGFMVYMEYPAYALMLFLLFLMGPAHPPTADDTVPLGVGRYLLGWLTLAFLIVGFTPVPIMQFGSAG